MDDIDTATIVGPYEFSNPALVLISHTDRTVAISIWDSTGKQHEYFVECVDEDGGLHFGNRKDYEAK